MKIIYDEYGKVTWPCSNCVHLDISINTCDEEKCIYPMAYCASEEQHNKVHENLFRKCNVCNKNIDNNEPYIVAYKNGIPACYCREHFDNAKQYLDFFQEFVDTNIDDEWKIDSETALHMHNLAVEQLQPRAMAESVNRETEFALQVDNKFDKYWIQGGKYYMQRGGEFVWHEISEIKYDNAYEECLRRKRYFNL